VDVRLPETPKKGAAVPSKPGKEDVVKAAASAGVSAGKGAASQSAAVEASGVSAQLSAVQELQAWQCVDEGAVSRLVAATKQAVAENKLYVKTIRMIRFTYCAHAPFVLCTLFFFFPLFPHYRQEHDK
jgi:hypothetical protein